jgi:O-antigen ligase
MNRYQDIMGRINYGLFLCVVALLPFPQVFLRYACVLWVVSWAMEGRWMQRPKSLRENRMAIPFLLFAAWYAWKAISGLWAADHDAWAWQMERYLSFGLLLPIGIWGVNGRYDMRKISKVLVVSCIVAIPFYLIVMTVLYYHREIIDQLQWKADWNYGVSSWYRYFDNNSSILKHRLFLCSVEMLGALLAIQLWRKDRKWLAVSLPVMLSAIPLTGSRQSILTCAALLAVGIIYALPQRYRLRYGVGILLLGMVIGGGLLKMHPRMQQFNLRAITEMREVSQEHDVRFNIYGCALQQPSDYIAYGLGAGQSTAYLLQKYEEHGFDYYIFKHYHAHNQYLEELMELGIAGLLLFVLAWLSIPLCAHGKGRRMAVFITVLFMLNMLTDCMFGKFDGIALWAVGLVLILLQSDPERQE